MNPASMSEPPIATERRKPKWLLWLSLGCLMEGEEGEGENSHFFECHLKNRLVL